MENLAGQEIKGYQLLERIGTGGFGAVYRAYQSTVNREVAIKMILPGIAHQPEFIRRFELEAQLVARLEHMNIVPLYDYWRDQTGAYLVMRLLRGGSLTQKLQQQPCSLEETGTIISQITSALATAHNNKVIHRDLKPANILLDEDGNAYLSDFGIAKDYTNIDGSMTEADMIIGSLDYISPEQARSEPVSERTDIYSLGVVLYEMLTGQHPFESFSPLERMYKHLNDPLPEVTTLPESIHVAANAVIQKASAKDPAQRYENALEFTNAFLAAAHLLREPAVESLIELLTPREHEVLQLMIDGLSNKEVAARLVVTINTVKYHQKQIYSKLHVRNRVQAIVRARELKLITSPNGSSDGGTVIESPSVVVNLPEAENPYKGLQAFQSADSQDFFGREQIIQKILDRMGDKSQWSRFLAVVGPSGSGKSSLVRAGVIPALWRGELPGSDRWFFADMLPGTHPLEELEIALSRIATSSTDIMQHLKRDERGLLRVARMLWQEDETAELVLVIDQFEEVFTLLEEDDVRQHFLQLLYNAVADPRSRIRVIITLRADFYDRPLRYPDFGEMLRNRMETVMPLSAEELEQAIVRPAKRVGVNFEEGLVSAIVSEVNYQSGALPLLQYALTELFEQREGRMLSQQAYQNIGGTVGALAKRADDIYLELDEGGQEIVRQLFLRLVTLGEGTEDTRRTVRRNELVSLADNEDLIEEIIDTYASYRMLSLNRDPETRSPTVEVAHEAILSQWERLRTWINDSREEIKMQQQLSRMAEEWKHANEDPSYLASGTRLQQMEGWAEETQLALTETEHRFLEASIKERHHRRAVEEERKEREATLEQRSVQRMRWLVAVFAVAAILSIGLSIFAFDRERQAEEAHATSEASKVVAERRFDEIQSLSLVDAARQAAENHDSLLALALAVQANRIENPPEQARELLRELAPVPGVRHSFVGHTGNIESVAFSPDGQYIVSGDSDSAIILWDVETGQELRRFDGHIDRVRSVTFSPDGQYIVSGGSDNAIILWDVETGQELRRFDGHIDRVRSVAFSTDGQYIVSGGNDSTIILWDVDTGQELHRFAIDGEIIKALAVSSDSQMLLVHSSVRNDGNLSLFNLETGERIHHLPDNPNIRSSVAVSPDGQWAFSGTRNNTISIWNTETGELDWSLVGHEEIVTGIAVSSRFAELVVSAGLDGNVIVWDLSRRLNGESDMLYKLTGHLSPVSTVAISPNGRYVLSSSDNILYLWDIATHSTAGWVNKPSVVMQWVERNRYIRDFTCEERVQYRVEPLCPAEGSGVSE